MTRRFLLVALLALAAGCQGYADNGFVPCVPQTVRLCTCYAGLDLEPGERPDGTRCGLGCSGQGDCPATGTQFCFGEPSPGVWSACDCTWTRCPEGQVRVGVDRCAPATPPALCL